MWNRRILRRLHWSLWDCQWLDAMRSLASHDEQEPTHLRQGCCHKTVDELKNKCKTIRNNCEIRPWTFLRLTAGIPVADENVDTTVTGEQVCIKIWASSHISIINPKNEIKKYISIGQSKGKGGFFVSKTISKSYSAVIPNLHAISLRWRALMLFSYISWSVKK